MIVEDNDDSSEDKSKAKKKPIHFERRILNFIQKNLHKYTGIIKPIL